MNGGYLMISKNDSDIYAKAQKALVLGKPILFYENATTCYYIDTISGGEITTEIVDDVEVTTYGDIILTKGGKTITITSANVITESGNINEPLMENIVDSAGNKRFIEENLTMNTISGVNFTYAKWSLSGTHLMIVIVAAIAATTELSGATTWTTIDIPDYIYDKIYPVYSTVVNRYSPSAFDSSGNATNIPLRLEKGANTLTLVKNGSSTIGANDVVLRLQIDLLIDAEYSE